MTVVRQRLRKIHTAVIDGHHVIVCTPLEADAATIIDALRSRH
ncbi:hypothetical protein [Gordonia sp. VNK21]